MSYQDAQKCFIENCNLIGPNPMTDPQNWNLNNGLEQFAAAVKQDLAEIDRKLTLILRVLHQ